MEGAANWFDQAAAEAANAGEMVFPEGYFSIRDKITDIIENDEAAAILSGALSAMSGMKLNKGMLKMRGGKTLEEMIQMVGQMGQEIPEQGVKVLNLQLNKIKKQTRIREMHLRNQKEMPVDKNKTGISFLIGG